MHEAGLRNSLQGERFPLSCGGHSKDRAGVFLRPGVQKSKGRRCRVMQRVERAASSALRQLEVSRRKTREISWTAPLLGL